MKSLISFLRAQVERPSVTTGHESTVQGTTLIGAARTPKFDGVQRVVVCDTDHLFETDCTCYDIPDVGLVADDSTGE